ncbi:uncharacterized protein LOC126848591 isoform X1 [Cataglyphis hispanica]|uniref:uncharacterized protein LOC126848591 isoform X1 n=1 Tax=Cataglyphis hispanica TaxID=1086592 RepID=UPI00217FB8FF|nr:uncharacterized protein LOC126848591 isoform X1 [Cataglyphis hispanica]
MCIKLSRMLKLFLITLFCATLVFANSPVQEFQDDHDSNLVRRSAQGGEAGGQAGFGFDFGVNAGAGGSAGGEAGGQAGFGFGFGGNAGAGGGAEGEARRR